MAKVFGRSRKIAPRAALPPPVRVLDCMELESRLLLSVTPLGVETLVNTTTANTQQTSPESTTAVAADANGNFVAVWASQNQDGSGWGIYGQRFNSSGIALGSEFLVNNATSQDQEFASVAMDNAGNFVVAWSTDTGGDAGVRAQRFNAAGVAQGGEIQVNTYTTDDQQYSSIAMDSVGNFVITWSSINQDGNGWGIYAQRFNAAGALQGAEFRVNTTTANDQMYSRAAMDADGDFVITWRSNGQDGSGWGIYGQRYNAAGVAQGAEFRVNTTTANDQRFSSVDMAANGNFVVTWTSTNQDGSGLGVYMQRYNANGTTAGAQTLVNTTTAGDQMYSHVAVSPNGDYLISWESYNQDQASTWGVYAKKYTAAGAVEEAQFRVNTTTAGDQRSSAVALTAANNAVFVWSGNGPGDAAGVFMQRYTCNDAPVVTTTASALNYTENAGAVVVDGALNLTDSDDTNMEGATITISANYVNGQDTLTFTNQNGITGSWNAATGTMTLSGASTTTNYRTALRSIRYTNSSDNPSTAVRTVSFVVNDGTANSTAATRNINIAAVNDAPVLAGIEGATLAYTENGSLPISALITVNDPDSATIASATVQITSNYQNGQDLLTFINTANITGTWNSATGLLTLSGADTQANYQAALRSVRFTNSSENPVTSNRTVTFRVNDGIANSNTQARIVTVARVNDAPVNTVPGPQSTNEDTNLVFSSGNGNQISVGDVDAGASPLRVTLTATNGNLTLAAFAGLSFTAGDGTSDTTMTFSGTMANINAALNGLRFSPTASFIGSASVQISTNDQGNTGSGGALIDSDTVNITVNPINDAPVVTTSGGSATYVENTPAIVDPGLTLSDVDDLQLESATVTITSNFVAGQDTLLFTDQNGITGSWNGATGALTLSGTATVAQYQTALRSIQYNNTSDNPNTAARTIRFVVNDGALDSIPATRNVTLQAVNDAPVNTVPGPQSTNEDTNLVFSSGNGNPITVGDIDAGASALRVTLSATNGSLTLAGFTGLSFTAGDGTADATMTFTGSIANINAALNGLRFAPTSQFSGAASLQIVTNDQGNTGSGGALIDSDTVNITVNSVNDAPVVTTSGGNANYVENTPEIVDPGLTLSDVDDLQLESATVTITVSFVVGQDTLLFTDQNGITGSWNGSTGVLTLTGTANVAQYQTALRSIQYNNTSDNPNAATRTITFVVNDGALDSLPAARNVAIQAVNDAPVTTVPGPQSINEDTNLVFSSGNGNQITVGDVDAGASPLRVTLTATSGSLTLAGLTGLSFTAGDGTADATMTFTGTIASINAALNGLSFAPTPGFAGAASLQIVTNDQGNSGAGGPLSDTDTVNIAVNAVDDAPLIASVEPAPIVFVENDAPGSTTSTITIVEADTGMLSGATVQISANYRGGEDLLLFSSTAAISGSWSAATGTLSLTGLDTVANYQTALRTVRYQNLSEAPDPASRTLTWTAMDGMGTSSNSVSRDVTIVSVNDAPTLCVPPAQTLMGSTVVFGSTHGTAITVSDVDAGAAPIEITLVAAQGFISLASMSGVTLLEGTGANDARLVMSGTLASVNQALEGLSFRAAGGASWLQIGANDQAGGGASGQAAAQIPVTSIPPAPPPITNPSSPPAAAPPESANEASAADSAAPPVQPPAQIIPSPAPPIDRAASSQTMVQALAPVTVAVARPVRVATIEGELLEPVSVFDDSPLRRSVVQLIDDTLPSQLFDERQLWEELQQISEVIDSELGSTWTIGAMAGAGAISAGYLLWMMRAGSLVASALSSLPVWNGFDPLPVLEFWERDQHDRRQDDDDDDAIVGGRRAPKLAC